MTTGDLPLQLGYTFKTFQANTAGIDHAASLTSPRPAGNCMNWVVGHLLGARNRMLQMLGCEPLADWGEEQRAIYSKGSEPLLDPSKARDFAVLCRDFEATQPTLLAGLGQAGDELLRAPAPFSPRNDPNETVGTLLVGLVFHEAYHMGQLGLLRRIYGQADSAS